MTRAFIPYGIYWSTPFAVNDIAFARQTGFSLEKMNNYGRSLIWACTKVLPAS
jgi:hypothetical protein